MLTVSMIFADNHKSDFLVLDEGQNYGINGGFGSPEEKFSTNFSTANTKVCLSLHYVADKSYLSVNGKKILKFKANKKMLTFKLNAV